MSFTIAQISKEKLLIRHKADYAFAAFSTFILLALGILLISSKPASIEALIGIVLVFLAGDAIWSVRELKVVIDKKAGVLRCQKGGFLGSQTDVAETDYKLPDINQLEIKRVVIRWRDLFKIRVIVSPYSKKSTEAYLSNYLNFSEAHQYAQQIHEFLGKEIPLKAVN